MHRKSLEAAEHLKSGGEDSGNDQNGSGSSPHHNHHQGGPTSSESGQESQDGMGPSSSTSKSYSTNNEYIRILYNKYRNIQNNIEITYENFI